MSIITRLNNLCDYLDSAGLKKESSELKVIMAQTESLTYEPLPEEPADTLPSKHSEEANGRKVEVIDHTEWTDDLANSITRNFVGEEWGKKHFASGIARRLRPILTMGEYGDSMTTELYDAWRSMGVNRSIIMTFYSGVREEINVNNEAQRNEIVGRALSLYGGALSEEIAKYKNDLNFEIRFTKTSPEPESRA